MLAGNVQINRNYWVGTGANRQAYSSDYYGGRRERFTSERSIVALGAYLAPTRLPPPSEYLSSNPADRPKLLLQLIRVSDLAKEYMTRAAPYFSPRLMAIESKADSNVQMKIVVNFIKPARMADVDAEALEAEPNDYRLIAS